MQFKFKKLITMDSHLEPILKLVAKIEQGLPEIQLRSITTLHTKLSVGLLDPKRLPEIIKLPGILMQWINQNNGKSEYLYKVLIIIQAYTKTEEGLQLLRQYEGLEYFQELRKHLLANQRNIQEFIDIIERIIKSLLPLGRTVTIEQIPNQKEIHQKQDQITQDNAQTTRKNQNVRPPNSQSIELSFKTIKQALSKKQDDALYGLLIELKHGKQELHFHTLHQIKHLLKYSSQKYFRHKPQLVSQLQACVQCGIYPYLCCSILGLIIDGLIKKEEAILSFQEKFINIDKGQIIKGQQEIVRIQISKSLFESIFSYQIYNKICNLYQNKSKKNNDKVLQWIAHSEYKFTYKNFVQIVKLLKFERINRKILINSIEFYAINFKESREQLFDLICDQANEKLVTLKDFPNLHQFLQQNQSQLSFKYIYRYVQSVNFDLNNELQQISQIILNLDKGINGLSYGSSIHHNLKPYIDMLLILTIAATRQDPLMTYFPTIKEIILKIAKHANQSIAIALYEEILVNSNSFLKINYLSKAYVRSEVTLLAINDEDLFIKLFQCSLSKESLIEIMLEITKKMILTQTNQCKAINKLSNVFFALTYSKNQKISSISQFILNKIHKKHKIKTILLQFFSSNEQDRIKISKDFLSDAEDILKNIILKKQKDENHQKKKQLKVNEGSISHYIAILFDESLEMDVKLSGGRQLLETIERAEITESIGLKFIELGHQIYEILVESQQLNTILAPIFIKLYTLISRRFRQSQSQNYKQIPCEILLNLLIQIKDKDARDSLLELMYLECFQSPFTQLKEMHFIMMYYPHIEICSMKVTIPPNSNKISIKNPQKDRIGIVPILKDHHKTNTYLNYFQFLIFQAINEHRFELKQEFTQYVEKEIGGALHGKRGDDAINLVCQSFQFLLQHKFKLPQQLVELVPSLLNSLQVKQTSDLTKEDITTIVSLISCKRSKQIVSIITSSSQNQKSAHSYKYILAMQLSTIQPEFMEALLKRLTNSNNVRQAVMILRIFIKNEAALHLYSEYTRMIVINSVLKFIQGEDQLVKKVSLVALIQILSKKENASVLNDHVQNIMSSLVGFINQGNHKITTVLLCIDTIRNLLSYNQAIQDIQICKSLLRKLIVFIKVPKEFNKNDSSILLSSIFSLINSIIFYQYQEFISDLDVIDTAINLISTLSSTFDQKSKANLLLFSQIVQFLSSSMALDAELPKYILLSSKLLHHVFLIIKNFNNSQAQFQQNHKKYLNAFVESIGFFFNSITVQEDLFISKVNQVFSNDDEFYKENIFHLLAKLISYGGKEYLKAFGWIIVIWWKGRNIIDQSEIGRNLAKRFIEINHIFMMKGLLSISIQAKKVVLSSEKLTEMIKLCFHIIQNKIVKEIKQGNKLKKKISPSNKSFSQYSVDDESIYPIQTQNNQNSKQIEQIEQIMKFLNALFYSLSNEAIEKQLASKEVIKKLLNLIQKFYIFLQYNPSLNKLFFKLVTNLSHSPLFSSYLSSHLSDNNSQMLEDILQTIIKTDSSSINLHVKRSFSLLSILIEHQAVRSQLYKVKLIDQLNLRLFKIQQSKKNQVYLQYTFQIIQLYIALSLYKDSNLKIMNDKKVLQALLKILATHKSSNLQQKIVKLLANLACYKQNKPTFMANRQIHKISLGLLQEEDTSYKGVIISLIYNLIYKNSAGIKLYRRPQVIELLKSVKNDLANDEETQNAYQSLMEALQSNEVEV